MAIVKIQNEHNSEPTHMYSSYQTAIFKAVETTQDNLIIEAVAGSGKTTTIVQATKLLDKSKEHIFLAFNKNVADELSRKVPYHIESRTMHSLCLGILRKNYKKVKVSSKRVGNLLYTRLNCKNNLRMREWYFDYGRDVKRVVSRIKALGMVEVNIAEIESLVYSLDLDVENNKWLHELIFTIFWESIAFDGDEYHEIDFDDMIYHVVTKADILNFPEYDTVLVDEAQDLNACQRYLVEHIMKDDGRLIAVGDTKQAIYGFRGADHESMRNFKREFDCKEFPLSISYRCSKAIVAHAKHFVPQIEHRQDATVGRVTNILLSDYRFAIKSGDYILCRTWAPLMREAMKLARAGHNVCILGKDIAPSLCKWAKDTESQYGYIDHSSVWDHFNLQVAGIPEGQEWKEYSMRDKAQTISYIVGTDRCTAKEIVSVIKEIFTDKPPVIPHVLLSTIHRVKGAEADRVFILRSDLLPHPLAKGHNELIQEDNLHYVAITRAKEELWYIQEEE